MSDIQKTAGPVQEITAANKEQVTAVAVVGNDQTVKQMWDGDWSLSADSAAYLSHLASSQIDQLSHASVR